jgi:hypothetical protein
LQTTISSVLVPYINLWALGDTYFIVSLAASEAPVN